jgi:hypothetical protein
MERTKIYQFTKADALEITSGVHPSCGKLVSLTQSAGSLSLHFAMTPEQAREMATALIAHADALEAA